MIIPWQKLDPDVLSSLIESFITREGTDYGETELSLMDKVNRVLPDVKRGQVLIVFDPETESVTLMSKEQYRHFNESSSPSDDHFEP